MSKLGRLDTKPTTDDPDPSYTEALAEDARATEYANRRMLERQQRTGPGLFIR